MTDEKNIKAQDTGKRIDVSGLNQPKTAMRRSFDKPARPKRETKNPEEAAPAEPKPTIRREETREPVATPLFAESVEFDDSGDFSAMLLESEKATQNVSIKIGEKVTGKVVHVGLENIFVAIGPKIEAAIATREFLDQDGAVKVSVGDNISSYVVSMSGGVTLSNNAVQSFADAEMLSQAHAQGLPVEGKVSAINKGGFDIQIGGKRAFCPISKIDKRFVEDAEAYLGKTLPFLIERIEEGGKNIVVSRRAFLERQDKDSASQLIKTLDVGQTHEGTITRVADFGAFVDIGGMEGLIPRSEVSHGRIDKVSDALSPNDRVTVQILSLEVNPEQPERSKVSFSLKKTKPDPYTLHFDKIIAGQTLEGRVVRLESFGAFVQLFEGIDGLIHISELAESRVAHPKDVLSIGDPVSVRVVSVDPVEKRVSLSLREAVAKKKPGHEDVGTALARGQKVSGVVSRIERYGVFLELENGKTALLPHTETGLPKGAELARAFNIGDKVEALVIEIDAQNRIRVSSIARKTMEERDTYLEFQAKGKKAGFGTFADLFKKGS